MEAVAQPTFHLIIAHVREELLLARSGVKTPHLSADVCAAELPMPQLPNQAFDGHRRFPASVVDQNVEVGFAVRIFEKKLLSGRLTEGSTGVAST